METRAIYDADKKVYKLNGSKTWLVLESLILYSQEADILSSESRNHELNFV